MTSEQYERWKDFSRRMVNVLELSADGPTKEQTLEVIGFFFDCCMDPCDQWKNVDDWDSTSGDMCPGDHMSDIGEYYVPDYWSLEDDEFEDVRDRWMGPATCCVRAGLDVAVSPSGGVLGFTAGDIREMYPEGVPQWVKEFFDGVDGELVALHPTNIEGIFHPEKLPDNRKFDELPDDQGVWL